MTGEDLAGLLPFCTGRQRQIVEAVIEHGNQRNAAKALGVQDSSVSRALELARRKAAHQGLSPAHDMTKPFPDGIKLARISNHYTKGQMDHQWVIGVPDAARQAEMQRAAVDALCEEITPVGPVAPPLATYGHLCNVYTLTDSHVGMRAHADESGAAWDLEIAERVLTGCFAQMIASSPPAHTCVMAELGDFLHFDSLLPITPGQGHVLDASSRLGQMIKMAVRILRKAIALCLQRHQKVIVLLAEGNHDPSSSAWLRVMFAALYENEPRVEVIDSEYPYYAYQHGETMLAWHHGHLKKNDQLPLLFASQFAKMWGATTRRYAHCGHRHHLEIKGHTGMTVVQHATIAPNDAYSSRHGYDSDRHVTAYTYSDKFGQVASNTVTPEMLP